MVGNKVVTIGNSSYSLVQEKTKAVLVAGTQRLRGRDVVMGKPSKLMGLLKLGSVRFFVFEPIISSSLPHRHQYVEKTTH